VHPVREALRTCPDAVREIAVAEGRSGRGLKEILQLADRHAIPVSTLTERGDAFTGQPGKFTESKVSQGVAARILMPFLCLQALLEKLRKLSRPPLLLALDSIQDPHNLGAIIRSAVAAGADGIILPRDRSAPLTGTVIKVSAGALFHIDICSVTNLVSSFATLKENGIWIYGAAEESSQPVYDTDLTGPACLVIGSEGKGLRPLVADHCDLRIAIPMHGALDSLNASVAAGIILFEIARQRREQSG
jgi:23S rRNA (guanosine2251-2'-O)-methyltransferase